VKHCIFVFLLVLITLGGCTAAPSTITVTHTKITTVSTISIRSPETVTVTFTPAATTQSISKTTTATPDTLQGFLESNFSVCHTSMGDANFTFDILNNDAIIFPWDYWIQVEYDSNFFYDLLYSNTISTEMNHTVCAELKTFMEKLGRAVITVLPGKKITCCYYDSWYRYPSIRVDLIIRQYYTWVNYSPTSALTSYDEVKVTEFTWYPLIDDDLER
jgi:hypothetical protein